MGDLLKPNRIDKLGRDAHHYHCAYCGERARFFGSTNWPICFDAECHQRADARR